MTKPDAGLITSLPASDPGSTAAWGSKCMAYRALMICSKSKLQTESEKIRFYFNQQWQPG